MRACIVITEGATDDEVVRRGCSDCLPLLPNALSRVMAFLALHCLHPPQRERLCGGRPFIDPTEAFLQTVSTFSFRSGALALAGTRGHPCNRDANLVSGGPKSGGE